MRKYGWLVCSLVTGLMSGILSIGREVLGFWKPDRFPEPRLLSASLVTACIISFALAWWLEHKEKGRVEREKQQLEELLADRYPRLNGEILYSCLEIGKHYFKDRLMRVDEDCLVVFYLRVVNHSTQDAHVLLPLS